MPKKLKGGPFSLVRYCMIRGKKGKPFWFSSLKTSSTFYKCSLDYTNIERLSMMFFTRRKQACLRRAVGHRALHPLFLRASRQRHPSIHQYLLRPQSQVQRRLHTGMRHHNYQQQYGTSEVGSKSS